MIYFFCKVFIYIILLIGIYHYYSHKKINILRFLIMLFLLNTYFLLLMNNANIFFGILITMIVLITEEIDNYFYQRKNDNNDADYLLIKHGNINFKGLIANKYSCDKLLKRIKQKGIDDISKIDYCTLYKGDLVIFSHNLLNYPVNLIVDGKVNFSNLNAIKKDRKWLLDNLLVNNLNISDISYAFYKDNQLYFITRMSSI